MGKRTKREEVKPCTACNKEAELGKNNLCNQCYQKQYFKNYYKIHNEQLKAKQREYIKTISKDDDKRQEIKEKRKEHNLVHKDARKRYAQEYYKLHSEYLKTKQRAYIKRRRELERH